VYIRFGRAATPTFTTPDTPFAIGKALTLWEPDSSSGEPQVAILSTGSISYAALVAARALAESGVESIVLHVPTVKPLDAEAVLEAAKRAGRVITVEEHQVAGGFGSAIAEFLSENYPVPVHRLGIVDQFGQSGSPEELLSHYGLDALHIEEAARALIRIY
jgi:transketolase